MAAGGFVTGEATQGLWSPISSLCFIVPPSSSGSLLFVFMFIVSFTMALNHSYMSGSLLVSSRVLIFTFSLTKDRFHGIGNHPSQEHLQHLKIFIRIYCSVITVDSFNLMEFVY